MYEDFFGLNRSPFELPPDPFFLFPSEKSREALASISYAICRRKGFVVMTGEVGTGKTLMLRCLFELWERQQIPFAHFIGPRLSATDFLSYIALELGIKVTEPTKGSLLRALYGFLLAQSEKGLTTVLVIDEAQQLPRSVLEEIRLLTNLETVQQKLVQILLVGQPEFDKKLDLVELRSLKQRIAVRCRLEPLNEEETSNYIARRLELAGADAQGKRIFPAKTIKAIHYYSLGIPRSVNNICDQSLIAAYARKLRIVPVEVVDEVASYFRLQPIRNLEQTEDSVSDMSRHLASAVDESAAFTPNTFPKRVKTPKSPPSQVPPQLEPSFRPDRTALLEDMNLSTSALRMAETVTTDSPRSELATSKSNSGTGRLRAATVAPQFPTSIPELSGDAQSVPETSLTSTPTELSIRKNLSSLRKGLQKYFRAEWRARFDAGTEFFVGLRILLGVNLKLIAVTVGLLLIASGMFWLRLGTAGNAAPKPTSVVAQMPRSTRNSNSVPDIRPSSRSVAINAEGRKANKSSETKRQTSYPAGPSVRDVTSDLQGSLNVNPAEKQEIEPVPALETEAGPVADDRAHAESPSSSGLASPSPSDSTPHGAPEVSEQIIQPRPLSSVLPTYPELAQRIRAEGDVVIQTLIDQAGKASDMQVLSGPVVLRQAALDALRRTRYEPGTLKGQPVAVRILVTVRFKL